VKVDNTIIANVQGSTTNYFASNTFTLTATQSALIAPNNGFYKSFSHNFIASSTAGSTYIISFVLSDSSSAGHKYWIRNINLK
jgi:hypothetical protein